jgi:hypothetical protein
MNREQLTGYLCSLPERVVRSLSAIAGGTVDQLGDVVLPARVRRSRLYDSLVASTVRFLVEQVGQVEGAYPTEASLPEDFLIRRTAGNLVEVAGLAAFRASPVWVLAALSDVAGVGRDLIGEIAQALQAEGLLEQGRTFESVDQLLDGLERTAGRLAETVNTPPLDVATLRVEWQKLRADSAHIPNALMPRTERLRGQWQELKGEAARQERSVWEVSSLMAVAAVRKLPDNARWLSSAARISSRRAGEVLAHGLLDHYRTTLDEIRQTGYTRYWLREFRPYLTGALQQFSPQKVSTTERLLNRRRRPAVPEQ